jgi:hypothetical protein
MTVVVIAYPPGGGGNHLKNILCLDQSFANSNDLNIDKYTGGEREVHSTTGRNMQQYRVESAESAEQDYVLHGHFGELAPWRDRINAIADKKFLVISIDSDRDQYLLDNRQHRLGQWGHEYYLREEQPYLYRRELYQTYFTTTLENIYTIALNDFWHPDLQQYKIVEQLNNFLNKNVDTEQAQFLHRHWHINNDITYY